MEMTEHRKWLLWELMKVAGKAAKPHMSYVEGLLKVAEQNGIELTRNREEKKACLALRHENGRKEIVLFMAFAEEEGAEDVLIQAMYCLAVLKMSRLVSLPGYGCYGGGENGKLRRVYMPCRGQEQMSPPSREEKVYAAFGS